MKSKKPAELSAEVAKCDHPQNIERVWLRISNCCDRGKFRVTLEINGKDYKDLFYSYPSQEDGVVSIEQNLTWLLNSRTSEVEALNERIEDLLDWICEKDSTQEWAIDALKEHRASTGGKVRGE